MTKLTKTDFKTKWDDLFADNTVGSITEALLREFMEDVKDSFSHMDYLEETGAIRFTKNAWKGSPTAPINGALSFDITTAVDGVEVVVFHQDAGGLTGLTADCLKLSISEAYDISKVNVIRFQYLRGKVIYTIHQLP